jgi:hypothetical protein
MVVKRIERSKGGCYFIAAKFVDRSCQVILRLSWCCRSLTENGLESFCFKWSREWSALRLLSALRKAWGEKDRNCHVSPRRSVNKSIYARDLRWDLA